MKRPQAPRAPAPEGLQALFRDRIPWPPGCPAPGAVAVFLSLDRVGFALVPESPEGLVANAAGNLFDPFQLLEVVIWLAEHWAIAHGASSGELRREIAARVNLHELLDVAEKLAPIIAGLRSQLGEIPSVLKNPHG